MPNGSRGSFRLSHRESPSPPHTSDSEDTRVEKYKYYRNCLRIERSRRDLFLQTIEKIGLSDVARLLVLRFLEDGCDTCGDRNEQRN